MKWIRFFILPLCLFLLVGCATTPKPEKEPSEQAPSKPLINLGNIKQITNYPEDDARPSFSSDGTKIVFHSKKAGEFKKRRKNRDIWVISVEGTNPKQLTTTEADDFNPVYSPDGKLIAYVSEADGTQDIWIMNTDGTGKKNLTTDSGRESYPAWSPEGERIVYSAFPETGGDADIWIVTLGDGKKEKLTNIPGNESFPTWHKDGKYIAFTSDKDGNLDVYVINTESKELHRLIETPHRKSRPSFSLDGTMIAYSAWEGDADIKPHIWVANANGTQPCQITHEAKNTHPAWSPTGREIAFHSDYDGNWDIWIVQVPEEVIDRAHFTFIGVIRGKGDKDVIKLETGDTLTGKVVDKKISLQTPYAGMDFPTNYLASINIASGEMFVINGDKIKGYILNESIQFKTELGQILNIRKEKVESIAFGIRPEEPKTFSKGDRIFLRNRDYLTGEVALPSALITSAAGTVDILRENLKIIKFLEDTKENVQLVFKNGDTLRGTIEIEDITFQLFYGPLINIYKGKINEIVFKN